jgi:Putative metallopeptidase
MVPGEPPSFAAPVRNLEATSAASLEHHGSTLLAPLLREPQMFLHEVSHARFDLLHIPILGHEVDAADQVAAYVMLQLGKDFARTTIVGV